MARQILDGTPPDEHPDRERAARADLRLAPAAALGHRPVAAPAGIGHSVQDANGVGILSLVPSSGRSWSSSRSCCSSPGCSRSEPAGVAPKKRFWTREATLRTSYRTDPAAGRAADQRAGGGARGHRPAICTMTCASGWSTWRWASAASRVRPRTSRTADAAGLVRARARYATACSTGFGVSRTTCIRPRCGARPRPGVEGALSRSREAARRRGRASRPSGDLGTRAPGRGRVLLSNRPGGDQERPVHGAPSDSRCRSADIRRVRST